MFWPSVAAVSSAFDGVDCTSLLQPARLRHATCNAGRCEFCYMGRHMHTSSKMLLGDANMLTRHLGMFNDEYAYVIAKGITKG